MCSRHQARNNAASRQTGESWSMNSAGTGMSTRLNGGGWIVRNRAIQPALRSGTATILMPSCANLTVLTSLG